jgi:NAD(P)-dependent dehydrogenase (short-subunit alcohol dehydrogenase family)
MSNARSGKVWFITGASRGFGASIAREALARRDRVVAAARNPQTVIDALGEQPNLLAVKLDVTSEADAVQIGDKNRFVEQELDAWRALAVSTDHA